jgi:hypothetical protein
LIEVEKLAISGIPRILISGFLISGFPDFDLLQGFILSEFGAGDFPSPVFQARNELLLKWDCVLRCCRIHSFSFLKINEVYFDLRLSTSAID